MDNKAYELGTTEVEVMLPLSEAQKVTIGQEKNKKDYYDVGAYLNNTPEKSEAKIYVDDTHLTHGVLFPGVNVFSQVSNSLCIFNAELHEWCDPNSQLEQVEKDRLDPMFSAILAELDLDKDKPTEFKAGKLNQISLSPSQHRRMTGLIAKHDNEWKTTRIKDFEKMLALYRHHGKAEQASRLEKRVKDLAIRLKVNQFDTEKQAYYIHPLGMVGWLAVAGCQCGNKLINQIKCTRYGKAYGPVYWGNKKLNSYSRWDYLISTGKITQDEKTILLAMSDNEGNMDAVHSYDSEILTAGAMQKTINSSGAGELPIQMFKFKQQHPSLFDKYFKCCGWDVDNVNNKYIAYYNGMTGLKLKQFLREGCSAESYGKVVPNKALAIFAEVVIIEEYQDLQVEDFVDRLNNKALAKKPNGYSYQISSYIKSNLGKATVLDHDVNRPGYVAEDFAKALNYFYRNHPNVNKNPNTWGEKHNSYEREIIEYYGNNRRGTDMVSRFKKLKGKL
ncbi:hypothetical protein [Actinobacillus equuli]|uniref:hypothetical protein n=1 Tax=Actinobacillus equuli TaxID=718 RepID=UPI0024428175|nr:hypothetical protein [Actinobacillus equuli]WGE43120.1 hypothetical protein NYR64_04575 [Actinobacillus equuli subsp. haemolyticus]